MQAVDPNEGPRWQPLERNERRALGVLVEKAKTTPSAYPLTLNSLRTGCNQKSNRFPMMDLEEHHVEEALEGLRKVGAVTLIQGDGRAEKYRHHAYDWLGVDKTELAVMAELLLRGAQTLGELRGRAARMEPIKGQDDLMPIIDSLIAKNLVIYLSRPGRGAVVTHNLYQPQELQKVKAEHGGGVDDMPATQQPDAARPPAHQPPVQPPPIHQPAFREDPPAMGDADLREEVRSLKAELSALRAHCDVEIEKLREDLEAVVQQLTG